MKLSETIVKTEARDQGAGAKPLLARWRDAFQPGVLAPWLAYGYEGDPAARSALFAAEHALNQVAAGKLLGGAANARLSAAAEILALPVGVEALALKLLVYRDVWAEIDETGDELSRNRAGVDVERMSRYFEFRDHLLPKLSLAIAHDLSDLTALADFGVGTAKHLGLARHLDLASARLLLLGARHFREFAKVVDGLDAPPVELQSGL